MPISVECDVCGKKYKFADHQAGKTVACKECGVSIEIPGGRSRATDDDERLPMKSRSSRGAGKRGKKSGNGSGPLILVAVGGGVAAVMAVAVIAFFAMRGGGQPAAEPAANNNAPPHLTASSAPADPTATPAAAPPTSPASVPPTVPVPHLQRQASQPTRGPRSSSPSTDNAEKAVIEPQPPENWTAKADPPTEPAPSEWNDKFKIPIPARRIDDEHIVYPVTRSPNVLLGSNDTDKDSREIWDLSQGKKTFTLKGVHITGRQLALSPDARYIAWDTGVGGIEVYDTKAKKSLGKLTAGTQQDPFYVGQLALLPGDRLVAQAFVQKKIKVWQLPGGELKQTIAVGDKFANPAKSAFSPGGKFMAVEADHLERTVRLYNLETGELAGELKNKRVGATIDLEQLAFSPDGSELACVADDYGSTSPITQFIIWSMADGTVKQNFRIVPGIRNKLNPDSQCYGLQWSPDGQRFLVHGLALVDRNSGKIVYAFDKPNVNARSMRQLLTGNLVASLDGDRTGGTLKPLSVSDEELNRAAQVADAGGIPEDLKLPPLTKANAANAGSPSSASSWSATPDPATPLANTVMETPLALPSGKGTVRGVHVLGGAAPKAFVRVAEGENLNDPKLNYPEIDFRTEDGRVVDRSRPRPVVAKENWIDVYDLTERKVAGKISVPFSADLASVSPDGTRILVKAHNAKGRLDVYDLDGKHLVGFRPYQSIAEEKDWPLDAAMLLDADHVLTVNVNRELAVWKIPECTAVYTMSKSTTPAVSPGGKYLACAMPHGVELRDALTGEGRGVISLAGQIRALAFHPQGDRLAIVLQDKGGAFLYVADLKTGALGEEIPSPVNVDTLHWCGDNYLLCRGGALLDLSAKTVAWTYKLSEGLVANGLPNGRFGYATPKSPRVPAMQLVAANLPEPKVVQELSNVKLEPQLIAQPGSTVSIKTTFAAASWAPSLAGELPKLVANAVEKAGLSPTDSNQPLKLTVTGTTKTGTPFELSEIGNRQNKTTIQDNQYEVKVVYTSGADMLWQKELKISSQTSTGFITHVPPNKSAQQVIDEAMTKRIEQFCEGLVVPAYVFSKKSMEGVGTTTLGGDGPVTGAVKK